MDGRPEEALGLFSEGLKILHAFNERYTPLHLSATRRDLRGTRRPREERLLGVADAHVEATELLLWTEGIRRREATVAELRAMLGEERYTALHAEGAAMSFDEAVEYAVEAR